MKQRHSGSEPWIVVALCPAIAVSDTLATAVAMGLVILALWAASAAASMAFTRLPGTIATTLRVLTLAAMVGCTSLLLNAWLHPLHGALGIFLPLLAASFAILSSPPSVRMAARRGAAVLIVLTVLGAARELVGRGSLLHDAAWTGLPRIELFPADLGFLLAVLPPGAFIACGLLFAARNWLRHRHEPDKDR